jgi:hypothetical protein
VGLVCAHSWSSSGPHDGRASAHTLTGKGNVGVVPAICEVFVRPELDGIDCGEIFT